MSEPNTEADEAYELGQEVGIEWAASFAMERAALLFRRGGVDSGAKMLRALSESFTEEASRRAKEREEEGP